MSEMKSTSRYSRFWSAFNRLTLGGNETSSVKEVLVRQYTNGRTEHLHEMRDYEYVRLCEAVERECRRLSAAEPQESRSQGYQHRKSSACLRPLRSRVLVEMRHLGVRGVRYNAVNWDEVDVFCLDRRIAGKRFCLLNEEELTSLLRKLIAMNNKRVSDNLRHIGGASACDHEEE